MPRLPGTADVSSVPRPPLSPRERRGEGPPRPPGTTDVPSVPGARRREPLRSATRRPRARLYHRRYNAPVSLDPAGPVASPVVDVRDLSKVYRVTRKAPGLAGSLRSLIRREHLDVHAVDQVSFTLAAGELVGFLGPNGAGKTTILKMLSGLLYPTAGHLAVLGHQPWKREAFLLRQFSLVMGQKNQLWWDLPALESFRLNAEIYGVSQ